MFLKNEAVKRGDAFTDLESMFADASGQLRTDRSNDGIHIGGDGYRT